MDPNAERIIKFFDHRHLPHHLAVISQECGMLAIQMAESLNPGPELTAGLRKLLEAKDCFVRARIEMPMAPIPKDAPVE